MKNLVKILVFQVRNHILIIQSQKSAYANQYLLQGRETIILDTVINIAVL